MKYLFGVLFLFASYFPIAQQRDTIHTPDSPVTSKTIAQPDYIDDTVNTRNLNAIYEIQKERDKKQKRNAMIRIGIGVALLVVLVIGVMRRKKIPGSK